MVEFDALFTSWPPTFETVESELRAVCEGRKALAWFRMTRDQVENYTDFDEVLEQANSFSLSVLSYPREAQERLPVGIPEIDIFVFRQTEVWRVKAFRPCRQTLGRYDWSDASEYLYSTFLGYSETSAKTGSKIAATTA